MVAQMWLRGRCKPLEMLPKKLQKAAMCASALLAAAIAAAAADGGPEQFC